MKLVRVDECVFVFVESACAYWYLRIATEGEREAGLGEIQIILEVGGLGHFFYQADTQRGVLLLGVMSVLWLRYSEGCFGE